MFKKGYKWSVVKDLNGMPTHKQGGVQLSIDNGNVHFASGDSKIHAANGLVLPDGGLTYEELKAAWKIKARDNASKGLDIYTDNPKPTPPPPPSGSDNEDKKKRAIDYANKLKIQHEQEEMERQEQLRLAEEQRLAEIEANKTDFEKYNEPNTPYYSENIGGGYSQYYNGKKHKGNVASSLARTGTRFDINGKIIE